jgi:hypothetical protein
LKRGRFAPPFIPHQVKVKGMSILLCETTSKVKFKTNQNLYTASLSELLAIFAKVQGQNRVDFACKMTQIQTQKPSFFCKKRTQKNRTKKAESLL